MIDAAVSPDGKTMAVASNIGSDFFRLYLTTPGDFKLRTRSRRRCARARWRGAATARRSSSSTAADGCNSDPTQATGALLGVFLPNFNSKALNASGDDPAFQPLTLGG